MSSTEIILIAAVFAFAGFRLYKKYAKKETDKTGQAVKAFKIEKGSSFTSHADGNEYEPYSGK